MFGAEILTPFLANFLLGTRKSIFSTCVVPTASCGIILLCFVQPFILQASSIAFTFQAQIVSALKEIIPLGSLTLFLQMSL